MPRLGSQELGGAHKAPADEVIRARLGFEVMINKGQQDVLNPESINVLRCFEGRGYRVWGRPHHHLRRRVEVRQHAAVFRYLEQSIDR